MKLEEKIIAVLKARENVLQAIERCRFHHLVKDNVRFYLSDAGSVVYKINPNLGEADRKNISVRLFKIETFIMTYNVLYARLLDECQKDLSLKSLKRLTLATVDQSDKFCDDMKEIIMSNDKTRQDGKFDIDKLKDIPLTKKVSLLLMRDMKNFELDLVQKLDNQDTLNN